MTPLFVFPFSGEVRKYSIKTVSITILCCTDQATTEVMLRTLLPVYFNALQTASNPEDEKNVYRALA